MWQLLADAVLCSHVALMLFVVLGEPKGSCTHDLTPSLPFQEMPLEQVIGQTN